MNCMVKTEYTTGAAGLSVSFDDQAIADCHVPQAYHKYFKEKAKFKWNKN